jgi:hypothetical protein
VAGYGASADVTSLVAAAGGGTYTVGNIQAGRGSDGLGVRKNVVQTKCAAMPDGWAAEGTATNPGKEPVTYKIVVHFTTTKATTLDYAQVLVPVQPGKTVPWTAKKQFQAQKKMLCPMPGIGVL